jgi:hypothetical protein
VLVLRYVCGQVVRLRIVLSSRSCSSMKASKCSDGLHDLTLLFELPPFNFTTSHQQDKSEFTFISKYFDPCVALPLKLRNMMYMKFRHCNLAFKFSCFYAYEQNCSRIGAISTDTTTHIEI